MKIDITPEEWQILVDSMRDRIGKLYRMSEAYRDEARMDCIDEKIMVQKLLEKFTEMFKR